jgi:hypothetical protein
VSRGRFQSEALLALEGLYERTVAVVAMDTIYDGATHPHMIGLRHDCDNAMYPAVEMAMWEAERGYRSTYYILHTAPYWHDKPLLRRSLEQLAGLDHEIGIHNDALTVALETGRDPNEILHEAIDELRSYGHTIRSTVAHGNGLCGIARYVNDEMFKSCSRPTYGNPNRVLEHRGRRVPLRPTPLSDFGLDFDANWLSRGDYLSDSGGAWSQPFDEVAAAFPSRGQLHMLVHPCWWGECWEKVAA